MREAIVPVGTENAMASEPVGFISPAYVIVPTTVEHLTELARTMREADRREIESLGVSVKKTLWREYRNSVFSRTALVDAKVAAIWGLAVALWPNVSPLSDLGIPWLHTSAAIEAVPLSFLKRGRQEVAAMHKLRPRLASYVDANYAAAVRFVELLGFTVDAPQPIGRDGAPFRCFHLDRD